MVGVSGKGLGCRLSATGCYLTAPQVSIFTRECGSKQATYRRGTPYYHGGVQGAQNTGAPSNF